MALVHARCDTVVFRGDRPNPVFGGLGSRFAVHCEPKLNHHYRALRALPAATEMKCFSGTRGEA